MTEITKRSNYKNFLEKISILIEEARRKTVQQINTIITRTYWEIGRLIVKQEQKGKERAKYGEALLNILAKDLSKRYGKGFTERNLRAMRQFYLVYPKLYAVRAESLAPEKRHAVRAESGEKELYALRRELSWTHFRTLMHIDNGTVKTTRKFHSRVLISGKN